MESDPEIPHQGPHYSVDPRFDCLSIVYWPLIKKLVTDKILTAKSLSYPGLQVRGLMADNHYLTLFDMFDTMISGKSSLILGENKAAFRREGH